MAAEQAPQWVRVQALVGQSGLPAALAMAGRPAWLTELAEDEVPRLRAAGVRVLRDTGGKPCVRVPDPEVTAWLAGLEARVTELAADIERAMQASREPLVVEIEHG
jgi:hypothetical protein